MTTLGRTLYAALARRSGATTRTTALIALGGLTTAALTLVPGPYALLIALSVAAGPPPVTDRWGTTHYSHTSGLLGAPTTTAAALAPFDGAALAVPLGGYPAMFLVLVGISAVAAGLALASHHRA